jgi:hypothetical protein
MGLVRTVPVSGTLQMKTVRIQYKCLVLISVFPEMKLRGLIFYRNDLNILSPNFHIHVSVNNLYIPRIDLTILLQPNRQTDPVNILYKSLTDT